MFIILFLTFIINVSASDTVKARIGNKFFDTLEEAILSANSTDTIILISDIKLDSTLIINKTINLDLNNHTISKDEKVFLIEGGSLILKGKGVIRELKPNYGAILLKGSHDKTKKDYSTVSVGSDIVLEGWSGIFIDHSDDNENVSYGILVNMNGTIKSSDDINNTPGAGIYVNGNIKNKENSPIVNLSDTTRITSSGNGIYSAGYATYNINGAYIEGLEAEIGMKSGIFNILNGIILGTGIDKTPTSGSNNGINPSGVAIQMESNTNYLGDMELYIKNGTITSKNSNVIYEYTVDSSPSKVIKMELSGGNYKSKVKKDVFSLSTDFKSRISNFISGGTYSSTPNSNIKTGYKVVKESDNLYKVESTTGVFLETKSNNGNNNTFLIVLIIILFIIIGIFSYLKRDKILDFIKKNKKGKTPFFKLFLFSLN